MELLSFYAISVGGILAVLVFRRIAPFVTQLVDQLGTFFWRYFVYPYFVNRHRLCGPWSRANVILCCSYAVIQIFFISFQAHDIEMAGRRAGTLSVIHMALLIPMNHLSFFANITGVSLVVFRRIHRVAGLMTAVLLCFHIILLMSNKEKPWNLSHGGNLFALLGSIAAVALVVFSISFIRRRWFEIFIRSHQCLAALFVYSTLRHLPSKAVDSRIYIYVSLGVLATTTSVQAVLFLFRNRIFTAKFHPRALITCERTESGPNNMGQEGKPLKIRIVLPRPLRVKAGQYVNIWLPTVSIMSWTQTHPFMVTSWSPEKQDVLELFVESRRGITKTLHARACFEGSSSYSAFIGGPYGASKSMNDFECVLAIATDFGISGIISYLKKLIYGYNTSTSYVRRVHFVWQVQSLGEKFSFSNLDSINYVEIARASESLLNDLLADDLPENGYMLEISFYIKFNSPKEAFGIRAPIYNGEPDYESIVSEESTGVKIPRVTNTKEEQGKTLVLVSARSGVRDRLRAAVNIQSNRKVCLYETDFQPN